MTEEGTQRARDWQSVFLLAQAFVIAMLVGVLIWSTVKSNELHTQLCTSQDVGLSVMTTILTQAQVQTDTNPKITMASKLASDKFVEHALLEISEARC